MFLALVCSFTMLQAQAWYVYDGSTVPDQLSEWSESSAYLGANFVETILDDPSVSGNTYFSYSQPDVLSEDDATRNAGKLYKYSFGDNSVDSITIIARVRGVDVDTITNETAFQFEYRINGDGIEARDMLSIIPESNTLKLEKSGGSATLDTNFFDWHIVRITFTGADSTSKVYVDEQSTVVLESKTSSSTTDSYLKFGDGGSAQVSGDLDWLIIDTSGAYAPGEGAAIPDSLSTAYGAQEGDDAVGYGVDLAFVTVKSTLDTSGFYADSLLVLDLEDKGFNVTVVDFAGESEANEAPTTERQTAIEAADVVVLSRTIGSKVVGAEKSYWANLTKPVVSLNTYGARAGNMGWLPSDAAFYAEDFNDLGAKAMMPDDTVFYGIDVPAADSIISFGSNFISFVTLTSEAKATLATTAELLLVMSDDQVANDYNKTTAVVGTVDMSRFCTTDTITPLMIRWAPGDSMFVNSGGKAARPFHYRTFIPGGDDHKSISIDGTDTKIYGMYIYSEDMLQIIANECAYLSTLEGVELSNVNTLDTIIVSAGTLSPSFSSDVTSYDLEVPSGTTALTVGATQTDNNASITGTGDYTLDGSDLTITITCTSQAGSAKEYSILVKEETEVAGNIIPPGTDNISTYVEEMPEETVFYLYNDSTYLERSPVYIDREITFISIDTVTLPALDNLPVIMPARSSTSALFQLGEGANLTLFGIECDGDGTCESIITMAAVDDEANYTIDGINIIRCRLHNVSTDIIDACSSDDTVNVASAVFTNSLVYDADEHGLYLKDCFLPNEGEASYVYDNLTFWNLGQQMEWISIKLKKTTDNHDTYWTFDHLTGYNLSTNSEKAKELIGNSSTGGTYTITLTNSIFSTQGASSPNSLLFSVTNANGAGDNTFTISNLALYECADPGSRDDSESLIDYTGLYVTDDPQFSDADNGDFTISNSDYLTGATDGTCMGALYWASDYVDDYLDYTEYGPGASAVETTSVSEMPVTVYPMPFNDEITFSIDADLAGSATISIFDISGRTVSMTTISLTAGANTITLDAGDIQAGTYFYNIATDNQIATGQLIKVN